MPTALRIAALAFMIAGPSAALPQSPDEPANPGRTIAPASAIEIAMDLSTGRPRVKVRVDGSGPYDFVVDTGASFSLIDDKIAEELGLEVVGMQLVRSPGASEEIEARRVQPRMIEAGALRVEQPVLAAMDLVGFSGGTFQGILGRAHFRDLLVTFDYPRSRLVVAPGALDAADPSTLSFDTAQESVRIGLDVGGTSVPVALDTGSPGGFTLPKAIEPKLAFQSDLVPGPTIQLVGGVHPTWRGRLRGAVRLADLTYRDPEVTLTTMVDDFGNLGFAVLRELVVTLDQANGLARFERPAGVPAAPAPAKARLGVAFLMTPAGFVKESGGLVVRHVDAGGAADEAGLEAGDIVVSVNDAPLAELAKPNEIGLLLRGPRPLDLGVLRDGDNIHVVIP